MQDYLRSLLDILQAVPGPGMVPPAQRQVKATIGDVQMPKHMQVSIGEPQFEEGTPQNPMQVPAVDFRQNTRAQDPVASAIAQTPNPNAPPMLPQQQADAQGQPWSPGNPGYVGPLADQPAKKQPKITLKLTPQILEMLSKKADK